MKWLIARLKEKFGNKTNNGPCFLFISRSDLIYRYLRGLTGFIVLWTRWTKHKRVVRLHSGPPIFQDSAQ